MDVASFEIDNTCPFCMTKNNIATNLMGVTLPHPGDVSICEECGEISVFNESVVLEKPDQMMQALIDKEPIIMAAKEAWRDGPGRFRSMH